MPQEVVKVEKDKDKPPKTVKKAKTVLNKVIVRRLPPNFTSEEFLNSIAPTEFSDFYYVNADLSLGVDATSRAYIEFKNQDDIFLFKDKFDGYVFLDSLKGTEYPVIVEYAPFQGLPKARARKDKHVGTIESEQHYQTFLENLKKAEDSENQKGEGKLEFSFQLKDDKKVTSTPLLEFIAAAKEEKREAKRKKVEEKKKQREDEKLKKKKEVAKNIPEPIKESKEEIVYDDGVIVRTVPSRLSRNDKNTRKDEVKTGGESSKPDKEAMEKERKEKRKLQQKERDEKRKLEREQQKLKDREAREAREKVKPEVVPTPKEESSQPPAKREVKRYSELRKARQEKTTDGTTDVKETTQMENKTEDPVEEDPWKKIQEARDKRAQIKEKKLNDTKKVDKNSEKPKEESSESKPKRNQEARDKKAREREERAQRLKDERAARQIRNKDRPTMQIYRPKRVTDGKSESANDKSSDEKSEIDIKRSDSIKSAHAEYKKRDERRRKGSRKGSSNDDEIAAGIKDEAHSFKGQSSVEDDINDKLEKITIEKAADELPSSEVNQSENAQD